MEVRSLKYFVEIVRCHLNLSQAAKNLFISQPSLSQMIKNIEQSENILLFERYKGRLQNLTKEGEIFYENALLIIAQYDEMLTSIRKGSGQLRGKVRIGIPPLVLSVVFTDALANLIIEHPDIDVEIIEKGAYELQRSFLSNELDLVILLDPTNIHSDLIEEIILQEDELMAFLHKEHPLAQKRKLNWRDLSGKMMATLDSTFMVQRKTQEKLEQYKVHPKKTVVSGSWDFIMLMVRRSPDFITVLPAPTLTMNTHNKTIVRRHFNDPISWKVLLCRRKNSKHYIASYVFDYLQQHFKK